MCLYLAGTEFEFKPCIRTPDECYNLIARNPVASARFFHFMVQMFLKHVLCVNSNESGLYSKISAYYGTVEQQGHLTLHLHLLLWINNSMSPQEIWDKLLNNDSEFQKSLLLYLENAHVGEFLTGTMEDINAMVKTMENTDKYANPTETLPSKPLPKCILSCNTWVT